MTEGEPDKDMRDDTIKIFILSFFFFSLFQKKKNRIFGLRLGGRIYLIAGGGGTGLIFFSEFGYYCWLSVGSCRNTKIF